jgi:uncharacterized protein YbjT (DUF2867 family)
VTAVLVEGATGSIRRLVVEEAIRHGYRTRALVRDRDKARVLPADAEVVVGDVTRPDTLPAAVTGIDAVVFTLGSHGGKAEAEAVDYGGVRNVLNALGSRTVRIALMTAIGVTNRTGAYNRSTETHDWKRRSGRLVRASGLPYTIVRPGWFDYNAPDEHQLVLLQGRHAPSRRLQRRGRRTTPDRRSPGPRPRLRPGTRQDLRTRRDDRPGTRRLRRAVRTARGRPTRRAGRRARHGQHAAGRGAAASARRRGSRPRARTSTGDEPSTGSR